MGYVHIPGSGSLTINSPMMSSPFTVDTIATNIPLLTVTIPNYIGNLILATAEFIVNRVKDTSGAENHTDGHQEIKMSTAYSGGYKTCIYLQDNQFLTPANGITGYYQCFSDQLYDIASYLRPGCSVAFAWYSAKSQGDDLLIYGQYNRITLYFR